MKIAIIGYGAMGRVVEKIAKDKGIEISAIIDPQAEGATHKEVNEESLKDADAAIEFSSPEVALDNIKKVAETKTNHIMATTAWLDKLDEARVIIKENNTGFLYASNFSIGVNAFFAITKAAAKVMNKIEEYDVFGYELHHHRKKDSPSGTAKSIAQILIDNIDRKTDIQEEKLGRPPKSEELHYASIRGGDIPGTHVVGFDTAADTIELKHTARTREGFALGSVMAASWIQGKKGFFEIEDMMKEIIQG